MRLLLPVVLALTLVGLFTVSGNAQPTDDAAKAKRIAEIERELRLLKAKMTRLNTELAKLKEPANDPAEQEAVDLIKAHEGYVAREDGHVVSVTVYRKSFTDEHLAKLAPLTKVRKMSLTQTSITGTGFKALTGLTELTELVPDGPLSDEGLKAIGHFKGLKLLRINGGKGTDAGFRELAGLKQLETFALQGTNLSNTCLVFLAENLKQLREVNVGNNDIDDTAAIALAKLPHLKVLYLHGTDVGDNGFEALAKNNSLEELYLNRSNNITEKSTAILAKSKSLKKLHLWSTYLTDKDLEPLGTMAQLEELDLRGSDRITTAGKLAFIKAHPKISVK